MSARIRTVHESEIMPWYEAGWTYVGPDEKDFRFAVLRWDLSRAPVQPLQDDEFFKLRSAAASLDEGRAG